MHVSMCAFVCEYNLLLPCRRPSLLYFTLLYVTFAAHLSLCGRPICEKCAWIYIHVCMHTRMYVYMNA